MNIVVTDFPAALTGVVRWLQGYVDVAQHREWVESTGGTIYLYHPFDPTLDYDELVNDLLWNVRREQGLEALLRVRCSSGIDVETYFGAFLRRETGAFSVYVPTHGHANPLAQCCVLKSSCYNAYGLV